MDYLIYLLKFVLFIAALWVMGLTFRCILNWYKIKRRQRKGGERFYELKYEWLQGRIRELSVTEENCDFIWKHLKQLGQLQHKNKEKTTGLTTNFVFGRFRPMIEKKSKLQE